jgi:hypothetical protein
MASSDAGRRWVFGATDTSVSSVTKNVLNGFPILGEHDNANGAAGTKSRRRR